MMSFTLISAFVPIVLSVGMAAAQFDQVQTDDPTESRVALVAAAEAAEAMAAAASRQEDAAVYRDRARVIRERLAVGDLRVGDKIVIEPVNLPVESSPAAAALADTFTVRSGQMLQLPGIAREIPLHGVLRFELNDFLTNELKRDYLNPIIRTTHMLGIFVTGQVVAPGARTVTQDALLRDVVTNSGTITPQADIDKITIRRQGMVIYSPDSTRQALIEGRTIEDMQLVGGDEIEVGQKRVTNWYSVIQVATGAMGLVLGIYSLVR